MGEVRSPYSILVGKPEGKRSLGRLRLRWEDNIRMDLRDISRKLWTEGSGSERGPVVSPCKHDNELLEMGNFLTV
jgi:hypothetical protein